MYATYSVAFSDVEREVPQAFVYQNKCIENWDDICTLFALDRATDEGAEQHEECADAMDTKIDGASTSENSSGDSNKRLKRDHLADAISGFVESFKEYVSRAQGPPKPNSQEIYYVVSNVLGISRHQVLRAVKRFMYGTADEFEMLKNLFEEQKLDRILLWQWLLAAFGSGGWQHLQWWLAGIGAWLHCGSGEVKCGGSGDGWGNQREKDRERAQARKKGGKKEDGLTPEQRRESVGNEISLDTSHVAQEVTYQAPDKDAKALQEKMAKKASGEGQSSGEGTSNKK
ncbi:Small EDRK-rich factor 1 [Bienertia sinuspersici]